MDRRRTSLGLLLLFVLLTGVSIVVGGSRPATEQGIVPWVIQGIGYLSALAGGVALLGSADGGGGDRRLGSLVLGALGVLVLVDAASLLVESGGANIGAGLVRVAGLVVIAVATARLAREVAGSGRAR